MYVDSLRKSLWTSAMMPCCDRYCVDWTRSCRNAPSLRRGSSVACWLSVRRVPGVELDLHGLRVKLGVPLSLEHGDLLLDLLDEERFARSPVPEQADGERRLHVPVEDQPGERPRLCFDAELVVAAVGLRGVAGASGPWQRHARRPPPPIPFIARSVLGVRRDKRMPEVAHHIERAARLLQRRGCLVAAEQGRGHEVAAPHRVRRGLARARALCPCELAAQLLVEPACVEHEHR
ncbi:hypothetical protein WMF46_08395 [Sorangium sp. So ce117]